MILYVDSLILTSDDEASLANLKKNLGREFQIKDLRTLKYFLRIKLAGLKKVSSLIKSSMSLTYLKKQVYLDAKTGLHLLNLI